jgi:hypothetical protein
VIGRARSLTAADVDHDLLTHPTNHGFFLRYDESADKVTISPELDEYLRLVIPTPRSKNKTFR